MGASGLLHYRETLARLGRRALARLRGDLDLDALVADGLELGERVYVARTADLDVGRPWLITIEDDAVISPHVIVLAHDASMLGHVGLARLAPVVIGKRVVVGAGAVILPGTRIGEDSVVAAGSVVRGEIPPRSVVVGNPGKVVSDIDRLAVFYRAEAARRPTWPYAGWSLRSGITKERMRQQRQALADGGAGFVAARPEFGYPGAAGTGDEPADSGPRRPLDS